MFDFQMKHKATPLIRPPATFSPEGERDDGSSVIFNEAALFRDSCNCPLSPAGERARVRGLAFWRWRM